MSFGETLDASMDSMEETRFKKKQGPLIKELLAKKKVHFSQTEIECLLIIYYKLQKDGPEKQRAVSKNQFRDILHNAFDMTDGAMMDRIFSALDRGPSIYVSMETWISALSLFLRGSLEEKISYAFNVYDSMNDGYLGRDTMFNLLKSSLVSQSGEDDAEEAAKDLIEVITKKMDIDRDGRISFQDFKETVMKQPMILQAFGQCLPTRLAAYSFVTTFTPNRGKL
ncbi:EF-hand calcium-binding domain-containing protein 1-like [Coccinella septempunctata]|uniref:EF-hand calcium-binding domain-containing protein 1-like n=1 Tax=Coccinella septempunctata TaxID=41139 RepID=UPI001D069ADD|nr:EF-hand calcium-binding domain-containing protein 1-like [Coccinella septempunctata]